MSKKVLSKTLDKNFHRKETCAGAGEGEACPHEGGPRVAAHVADGAVAQGGAQDGAALGLCYSSPRSLAHALDHGVGAYESRNRGLWVKGQTSGHTQELLEVRSIPLRNYLMQNVIPTLTEGLIEVCKLKPEDPVDYLAEWLFKNNPIEEELSGD